MSNFFEKTNNETTDNSLWVEHYRPKSLDTYVGNEHLKSKVQTFIKTNDIPHLLFHGKAGGGKTTLAKLIVNSIECDYMIINASAERGIDTIRDKVRGFASTVGFKKLKVIILDESDFVTAEGQGSLRNVMETFSNHCRFILTCNFPERIIDAIQSRCQTFHIIPPSKKEIAVHISSILGNEGVSFEPKQIVPIIDSSYPDIRKIINTCQLNSIDGELKVDVESIIENDYKQKIFDILKSDKNAKQKYTEIRTTLKDSRVTDFSDLYSFLYEKVDEYAPNNTSGVILTLSEAQYRASLSIDKEIPTMAALIEILTKIK